MTEKAVMYVTPETRTRIKRFKGVGKSYDRFLKELMDEYEHRSPSAKISETGNPITGQ